MIKSKSAAKGKRYLPEFRRVSMLIQHSLLCGDAPWARKLTFHVLADHLYGNASIDIPIELGKP